MSPEHQRRRRADAEQNRAAILAAARRLFDDRGAGVPLDEIARTAGIGNATLYRHFPTRTDLLVAAYDEEVDELDRLGDRLVEHADPDRALTAWLGAFVRHVATKRDLALAVPAGPDGDRETRFAGWHATMTAAAGRLLDRARDAGVVRPEVTVADLLALAQGVALAGTDPARLDALLALVRDGYRPCSGVPAPTMRSPDTSGSVPDHE